MIEIVVFRVPSGGAAVQGQGCRMLVGRLSALFRFGLLPLAVAWFALWSAAAAAAPDWGDVDGPYLEMFARSSRPGWDSWGTEADLLDGGAAPKRRWRSNSYPDAAE